MKYIDGLKHDQDRQEVPAAVSIWCCPWLVLFDDCCWRDVVVPRREPEARALDLLVLLLISPMGLLYCH